MKDYAKRIAEIMPENPTSIDFYYMLANLVSYAIYKGIRVQVADPFNGMDDVCYRELRDPTDILDFVTLKEKGE